MKLKGVRSCIHTHNYSCRWRLFDPLDVLFEHWHRCCCCVYSMGHRATRIVAWFSLIPTERDCSHISTAGLMRAPNRNRRDFNHIFFLRTTFEWCDEQLLHNDDKWMSCQQWPLVICFIMRFGYELSRYIWSCAPHVHNITSHIKISHNLLISTVIPIYTCMGTDVSTRKRVALQIQSKQWLFLPAIIVIAVIKCLTSSGIAAHGANVEFSGRPFFFST